MPQTNTKKFPWLSADLNVDVAIIGGGLAGIDTAYLLSQTGKQVAVLEAKTIGSGATSKTTAFLTQVIDTNMTDLVSMFGATKAKMVWESHGAAIDTIEAIVKKENLDCGFMRCPNYSFALTSSQFREAEQEYGTLRKLGLRAKLHRSNQLPFATVGNLEVPNQGKYNAHAFIQGLAACAARNGVQIFEQTRVSRISGKKNITLIANNRRVTAKQVIIATYDPFGNPSPTRFKKGMYVSYVFELRIPKGSIPEAIYEDMDNPYHYFRIDRNKQFDTMIIGGEDHREELKMNPAKNYRALEQYVKETFPGLEYKILSRWTGPILEPSDGLPLIGEYEPNKFVACAFSGNGMTYSMITALLLRDVLNGKKNPWQKLYDPKRTPSLKQLGKKALDYGGELVGGAIKNFFK